MNKDKFLRQLDVSLKQLTSKERQDILQDYEEHFAIGLAEGKTEEEIAASLGSPSQISKDLLASYHLDKVEATVTTGNIIRAIWAVIGLGFFNLVIVLGPFIALLCVLLSGWILGFGFVFAPLLVLIDVVINSGTFQFFDLFISLALCGIGLFILIGMIPATKVVVNGFVRYLKFNASIVKGGLKRG